MDSRDNSTDRTDWLALPEEQLLAQCDVHTYRSSGPGGQHRNKVSSAVRLRHRPTGISAHGDDSRSQHENKRLALQRLRMNIALTLRRPVDLSRLSPRTLPPVVAECRFVPRGGRLAASTAPGDEPGAPAVGRLQVGRKDHRFWNVAQFLLDLLAACEGRVADAAAMVGVTTSNFVGLLQDDRHLFGAAQQIRKQHALGPLK